MHKTHFQHNRYLQILTSTTRKQIKTTKTKKGGKYHPHYKKTPKTKPTNNQKAKLYNHLKIKENTPTK